ncbi:MAG: putative glycoside hydrolase [Patescibacteria group bacterium]
MFASFEGPVLEDFTIYRETIAFAGDAYEKSMARLLFDSLPPSPPPDPAAQIGVYVHMNNLVFEGFLDATVEKLKSVSGTAIVFDVKGSYVYFPTQSTVAQESEIIKPLYELPEIVAELKNAGIYTIARVIALKDPRFAFRNPEVRLSRSESSEGTGDFWVKPEHELTLIYNQQILAEILAAGVDEINLDFIRYPSGLTNNFLHMSGEEKIANLEKFIRMAKNTIDSLNPNVKLSINTFAILAWDYESNRDQLGQDVVRFAPYVDIIAPMLYPATFGVGSYYNPRVDQGGRNYNLIKKSLEGYQRLLGEEHAHKLRPWIQGYGLEASDITNQIRGVWDAGVCGFTVWEGKNYYAETYKALKWIGVAEKCR